MADIRALGEWVQANADQLRAASNIRMAELAETMTQLNPCASFVPPSLAESMQTTINDLFRSQREEFTASMRAASWITTQPLFPQSIVQDLEKAAGVAAWPGIADIATTFKLDIGASIAATVTQQLERTAALRGAALGPVSLAAQSTLTQMASSFAVTAAEMAKQVAIDFSKITLPRFEPPEILLRTFDFHPTIGEELSRLLEDLRRWTEKGSPFGDLLIMGNPEESSDERVEAAKRLVLGTFTFRRTFFHQRRIWLEPAFRSRLDGRSRNQGWLELVMPILMAEVGVLSDDTSLYQIIDIVRNKLRSAIEIELVGHTLDSQAAHIRNVPLLSEHNTPDPSDPFERVHLRIDVLLLLRRVPEADAQMLLTYYDEPDEREALATTLGITYGTLRKRVSRWTQKLGEIAILN